MEISLSNVMTGRLRTNTGWRDMTDAERYPATLMFRKYIVGRCRSGSKRAVQFSNMSFYKKKTSPFTDRLIFDTITNTVSYTSGQDMQYEIEELKRGLLKG